VLLVAMAWIKAAGKGTLWSRGGGGAAAGKKGEIIKSPSMLLSYVVALSSMLVGASIVHNILKPDLVLPPSTFSLSTNLCFVRVCTRLGVC